MEILILTLTRGSVYALVAAGFVLVFSVGGILNLAHGTLFMLGAYFTFIFYHYLFGAEGSGALLAAIPLAIASVMLTALLLYYVVLRRRLSSLSYVMVASLAAALFVEEVVKMYFGVTSTGVPSLLPGSQTILGVRVLSNELLLVPVAVVTLGGLLAFLRGTRTGKAIQAAAQNPQGAVLIGINPDAVLAAAMAISAGLAALAGCLVAPLVTVTPSIWGYWLIKAFAIAILGGLGSLPGSIVAAFILSFVEIVTTYAVSEQFADLVALVVIVAVLVARPSGIMGNKRI